MACEPWPVDPTCLPGDWPPDPDDWTPQHHAAVQIASELLRMATAYQYGQCQYTVRTCGPDPAMACDGPCGCAPVCSLALEHQAWSVDEIWIDGEPMPAGSWRVYNARMIILDGRCFPACQRLDLPLTEPGTWGVTYTSGAPIPAAGRRAVAVLAGHVLTECADDLCSTDMTGVTQISMDGLTRQYGDLTNDRGGRFGLGLVDDWLALVNPHRARRPASILSPDDPPYWYYTGGG